MIFYTKIFRFLLVFVLIFNFQSLLFGEQVSIFNHASAQMSEAEIQAQEAKWRSELEATQKEIDQWEAILNTTKQGTASLQRDADILKAKINEAKAFIRNRQIQIERLTRDINLKTKTIDELEAKIARGKESLSSIIRSTNELDSYSLPEAILSNKNFSEFFEDIDSYGSIKESLAKQFAEIRELQNKTDEERKILDEKREAEADTKARIEEEKKKVEINEQEKQRLININKNQEKTYEQVIAEKERKAAQIRAELFKLRDSTSISFGEALKYANKASQMTGVRAAYILGVIQQESNIGQNLGSCIITDLTSGSTQHVTSGRVYDNGIHPTRDLPALQEVLDDLGRDPLTTRVSCPYGSGYGGAMGPAQFIPSTWKLYINRLTQTVGSHPDPWNPEHAFIASAFLLADNGAAGGGYTAEYNAACRYYSGSKCPAGNTAREREIISYGKSVVAKANNIQLTMIDPLEGF